MENIKNVLEGKKLTINNQNIDINEVFGKWYDFILNCFNTACIQEKKNGRYVNPVIPWISSSLLKCIAKRHMLYKKAVKGTYIEERCYSMCKILLNKILRRAKKHYDKEMFKRAERNHAKTWRAIKEVTNKKNKRFPDSTSPTRYVIILPILPKK